MWRAANNLLPTFDNLQRRRLAVNNICPFCQSIGEVVARLLRDCDFMCQLMRVFQLPFDHISVSDSLLDWLAAFFVRLSASNRRPTAVPRWEAPYLSVVKINFDSAFNLQDRSAMSGAVVRNNEGLILAPCVVPHSNVSNTFVAEALACKNVVQVAKDMRFFEVIIEGDSLTVVKKLNSTIQDSFIISPIIVDIKDLAKSFHSISFRFVRRGENKVAHSLARESRLVQGSHF
ncbi:hypothetical protein V6N13_141609 [Hibiscus sabdariffa]|uniref:RNase H type-1 domain-containing protein n=2 Tax=Hibiscus sabdariffa TaxID=183260 RepID=A0ABR1ZYT1_9ROSI